MLALLGSVPVHRNLENKIDTASVRRKGFGPVQTKKSGFHLADLVVAVIGEIDRVTRRVDLRAFIHTRTAQFNTAGSHPSGNTNRAACRLLERPKRGSRITDAEAEQSGTARTHRTIHGLPKDGS